AVRSALNQTLSRDLYEVIVVKNFRDDFIDSKLGEWGVTNLYSESVGIGAKIYEALQVARGEVISFLDDDDEFLPGKLKAVYEAFQRGADYYHNEMLVINEAGHVLRNTARSSYLIRHDQFGRYLRFMAKTGPSNNSSIALKAGLLKDKADFLRRIGMAADHFSFTLGLVSGHTMFLDGTPLTLYRFHSVQSQHDFKS
ncbi:MAG: glycosyltransferase, partial [Thermoprotei archaeon]